MVGPRLSPPFYRSSDGQWLVWVREPTGGRPYLIDTSAHYVLLTLSFCAGRQDLALPLASFWLRLRRAVSLWFICFCPLAPRPVRSVKRRGWGRRCSALPGHGRPTRRSGDTIWTTGRRSRRSGSWGRP